MVYRSFYVTKVLVVACLFVFLNDYPLFSVIFLNFLSLASIIVVGFTEPYLDRLYNKLELMNECFLLVTIYHFFCFTDYVSDYTVKDQVGVSLIVFTLSNLVLNLATVCYITMITFIQKNRRKYLALK